MSWGIDQYCMTKRPQPFACEAEVAEGLEGFAREELRERFPQHARLMQQGERGIVGFSYSGDLRALSKLRTIEAVFLVQGYDVPRPKALLGDANFRRLVQQVQSVLDLYPGQFSSLYLSAAGAHTPVMQRIKHDLARQLHLEAASEKGDTLLRIRPGRDGGWETLVRLTPRPLSTRSWRVCNYEASLNATVAHVMALLTTPTAQDTFVNLGCGSGTLLIERLAVKRARRVIGVDSSAAQLECTATNLAASGGRDTAVQLLQADMTQTPLPAACTDAVCADLPFGQRVGSHQQNQRLYPRVLDEAARISRVGGRLVLITHEIRLMEQLATQMQFWAVERQLRVTLRGLHPAIYLLRRQPDA